MNGGNRFVRKCIEGWRAKAEALPECLNKLFKLWDGDLMLFIYLICGRETSQTQE